MNNLNKEYNELNSSNGGYTPAVTSDTNTNERIVNVTPSVTPTDSTCDSLHFEVTLTPLAPTPSVTPTDPTCDSLDFEVTLTPQVPTPSVTPTLTPTPTPQTNVTGQTVVFVIDSGYFECGDIIKLIDCIDETEYYVNGPIFFNGVKLVSNDIFTAELNGEEKCVRFVSETNGSSTHFIQNITEKHVECCVESSPTPTNTPSITQTPTNTTTPSVTETSNTSPTPTNTPSITQTPTNTTTPSVTETSNTSPTPTITNTPSITVTPSNTSTPSVTQTPTVTMTPSTTPPIEILCDPSQGTYLAGWIKESYDGTPNPQYFQTGLISSPDLPNPDNFNDPINYGQILISRYDQGSTDFDSVFTSLDGTNTGIITLQYVNGDLISYPITQITYVASSYLSVDLGDLIFTEQESYVNSSTYAICIDTNPYSPPPSVTNTVTPTVTPSTTPSVTPSSTSGDKTIYVYYPNL